MKTADIKLESIYERVTEEDGSSVELLKGEISGAAVSAIRLAQGSVYTNPPKDTATVFVVFKGSVKINDIICDGRGLFAFAPKTALESSAKENTLLLCIAYGAASNERLSHFIRYDDAPRYKEACKSEKTVNRMLLSEGLIPDLAIGSVETSGPDAVAAHDHPFCDQLFISFEENAMYLEIEGVSLPMGGNEIVHIPLGSKHGVRVPDGGYAHYVWIDFVIDAKGKEYLRTAHEML